MCEQSLSLFVGSFTCLLKLLLVALLVHAYLLSHLLVSWNFYLWLYLCMLTSCPIYLSAEISTCVFTCSWLLVVPFTCQLKFILVALLVDSYLLSHLLVYFNFYLWLYLWIMCHVQLWRHLQIFTKIFFPKRFTCAFVGVSLCFTCCFTGDHFCVSRYFCFPCVFTCKHLLVFVLESRFIILFTFIHEMLY